MLSSASTFFVCLSLKDGLAVQRTAQNEIPLNWELFASSAYPAWYFVLTFFCRSLAGGRFLWPNFLLRCGIVHSPYHSCERASQVSNFAQLHTTSLAIP